MITPTAPDRAIRLADFATLTEALDYAATGVTGMNLYSLRGELVEALPYSTLRTDALALGKRLLASGLQTGDRVGLIAETDGDFVRGFFACQYAGLIPAPLPLPAALGGRAPYIAQIARLLQSADAAAVFGPEAMLEWIKEAAEQAGVKAAGLIRDLPEGDADLPAIVADGPCYLQFSSGSTRFPTGVLVTHQAMMANAVAITRDGLKVKPDDRAVSWLPLYHDMGMVGFLLSPMSSQMSVDLLPTGAFVRRPLLWLDLISKNGGTISYSPSFGFELCARRGESAAIDHIDLSKWRVAGIGGDMIRMKPLQAFADTFGKIGFDKKAYFASYGMAEATLALSMAPLDGGLVAEVLDLHKLEHDGVAVPGTDTAPSRAFARCGPALPGHELEVRDIDGSILPERRVGRIFARGPSLMRGYFRQPEITSEVLSEDGWLDTGDLGYFVDGEIVITGRAKDLIILNGRNIWPQDLEWTAEAEITTLRSGDVAAFSVAGDGEEAIVVLAQCRSSDPEVRGALVEEIANVLRVRHSIEARVQLVGSHALPQTSSGKLSRSKAKAAYIAGAFAPEAA
ncbi:fatty acyl-AMP ligase [Caulobacter sp. NIBR2454]|uniref:fatty acyl-AMP ligase n=1 Tax=Caulobacter sp. NIBR2454 TaxID=3015996 RepID=UPI0022B66775|nr:fatty acyl-AMP ligase [Caulobacter sp. NIBR2454]